MKRIFSRLAPLLLVLVFVWMLDKSFMNFPPVGRFLDPFDGFWANAEKKPISLPENLIMSGLKNGVTIHFDKHLIPHIKAENNADLYFAQGYVTAFHRLWQMDFEARCASGQLAEILGPQALAFDRLQRRKGISLTAKKLVRRAKANPILFDILISYAAGVNAYINSLSAEKLPIEYKLMNFRPTPWSPYKTALLAVWLIDQFIGQDAVIANTNAYHLLGKHNFNLLFPEYSPGMHPTIPKDTTWPFNSSALQSPPSRLLPLSEKQECKIKSDLNFKIRLKQGVDKNRGTASEKQECKIKSDLIAKVRLKQGVNKNRGTASEKLKIDQDKKLVSGNAWAVRGKKTSTGKPFLANDIHLPLQLPSSWYLIHLNSPESNTLGASFTGLPTILMGFNENIAWGLTNNPTNVRDWYAIDFVDPELTEYRYDNRIYKTHHIKEVIKIKGQAPFHDTIIYTHHGPIVYDSTFSNIKPMHNLAMKWTGDQAALELLGFYHINNAKDHKEFENALEAYNVPLQTFIFADIENNIALYLAGKCPVRWPEQGKFVMPGDQSTYEWNQFIVKEHIPKLINPIKNYLCTANERPTDLSYPYYYTGNGHGFQYRNKLIYQALEKTLTVNASALMKLQNDTFCLQAEQSIPLLLKYLSPIIDSFTPEQKKAYNALRSWNCRYDINEIGASVYKTWCNQLVYCFWKPFEQKTESITLNSPSFHTIFHLIKNKSKQLQAMISPTIKENENENKEDYLYLIDNLIRQAFLDSVEILEQWEKAHKKPYQWGVFRNMPIPHIGKFQSFGLSHVEIGGDETTINHNIKEAGVGIRLIVSLKNKQQNQGWMIYPGGQPGNPGNPYYTSFITTWQKGKYLSINLKPLPAADRFASITLSPRINN